MSPLTGLMCLVWPCSVNIAPKAFGASALDINAKGLSHLIHNSAGAGCGLSNKHSTRNTLTCELFRSAQLLRRQ
jgi:hypothetical protein